jgi:hypothetical protein
MMANTRIAICFVVLPLAIGCLASFSPAGEPVRKANAQTVSGHFKPIKDKYTADEPILVDFAVKNESGRDFEVEAGGDYRFAGGRSERFNVEVVRVNDERRDPRLRLETGDGMGQGRTLKPGETYTERLFLNTWDDFSTPGKYTVTCRRVLTNDRAWGDAPGWVTVRLSRLPLDITRPDARKKLLKEYVRANAIDSQKVIEAIDTYVKFPQIQGTFEIEVTKRDPKRLREVIAGLREDQGDWEAHWYVYWLAEKLAIKVEERTAAGIGNRPFEDVKRDVLAELDREVGGADHAR